MPLTHDYEYYTFLRRLVRRALAQTGARDRRQLEEAERWLGDKTQEERAHYRATQPPSITIAAGPVDAPIAQRDDEPGGSPPDGGDTVVPRTPRAMSAASRDADRTQRAYRAWMREMAALDDLVTGKPSRATHPAPPEARGDEDAPPR